MTEPPEWLAKLQELRTNVDMTYSELAAKTGFSRTAVGYIFHGTTRPRKDQLEQLLGHLTSDETVYAQVLEQFSNDTSGEDVEAGQLIANALQQAAVVIADAIRETRQ